MNNIYINPTYDLFNINIKPATLAKTVVLMGGTSNEREISLISGNGVLEALLSAGVDAVAFDPAQQTIDELLALKPDRVVVILHGRYGEDGCIQGVLETLKLPYTGSGVMASSIAMDKVMTKRLWLADGLPTPQYRWVRSEAALMAAQVELGDLAVKPLREGSSLGFSRAQHASDIPAAWATASSCGLDVLAEQFINGRELTVAVLRIAGKTTALPIVEIKAEQGKYDYQNKYFTDTTVYETPAHLSAELTAHIQQLSEQAFDSIGCEGWGRIDLMLHHDINTDKETPYLLEINTVPGMTGHSLVPMAAKAIGLDYPTLCCLIASTAGLKG
jgi:D-alanine-D-alanine ligase